MYICSCYDENIVNSRFNVQKCFGKGNKSLDHCCHGSFLSSILGSLQTNLKVSMSSEETGINQCICKGLRCSCICMHTLKSYWTDNKDEKLRKVKYGINILACIECAIHLEYLIDLETNSSLFLTIWEAFVP